MVVLICPAIFAQSVGWYNGDLDPNNLSGGITNYYKSETGWNYIFDDFDVPSGGWHIVSAFSNNLLNGGDCADMNQAHWEIRIGLAQGNLGTVIDSGTSPAVCSDTGRTHGQCPDPGTLCFHEYRMGVSP